MNNSTLIAIFFFLGIPLIVVWWFYYFRTLKVKSLPPHDYSYFSKNSKSKTVELGREDSEPEGERSL